MMHTQQSTQKHILKLLGQCYSRQQFFNQLKKNGYSLLHKHGTVIGIKDKEEGHTFDSLGISSSQLQVLDMIDERVKHRIHKRLQRIEQHLGIAEPKAPEADKKQQHKPKK